MSTATTSQYAIYPSLRNKTVVITGGAEGIGGAASELFAAQGSKVVILDIATGSAEALIAKIRAADPPPQHPPVFYHCDVTDLARLQAVAEQLLAEHGGAVHVLINNAAGTTGASRVGTAAVTAATWQAVVDVNLRHQFFLTQHLVPAMTQVVAAGGTASVINMGSISWRIPSTGVPVYAACKAATTGLTRTLAREFGPAGVRVNCVMPGAIATQRQIDEVLTPAYVDEVLRAQALKTLLLPADCARLLLFLASDDASGVTGSSYVVDAGWVGDP